MAVPHQITIRVYYEDTDFSGYVYHAGYLRFFERGRTEFLRSLGLTQSTLHRDTAGLVFVVSRITVDYLRPAGMDDMLSVATTVAEARGPLVRLHQEVKRGDETLTKADVTVVAVQGGRPVRLPPEVAHGLSGQRWLRRRNGPGERQLVRSVGAWPLVGTPFLSYIGFAVLRGACWIVFPGPYRSQGSCPWPCPWTWPYGAHLRCRFPGSMSHGFCGPHRF